MTGSIIPCLRCEDAPNMITWLCDAFGFERHAVYKDSEGGIAHAQLTHAGGMVMLGSARADEFGELQTTPGALGLTSGSAYVIVADADAAYERAKAGGAEIVLEIRDEDYGGRGFSCRDPEGHLWNFGSYDPWSP